jgi:hypothetical protein
MVLAERCRDVIVGTILGDACLERNWKNVRLRIEHSESQRSLVEWKHGQFAMFQPSTPKRVEVFDSRTNKTYVSYRFLTRTTAILNEYFELFYGAGKTKHIPEAIYNLLTSPLSVAVWYMDDGSRRNDCRSGYFNTQGFSQNDVNLLRKCLSRNFNLETSVHYAAGRPRIYLARKHFERFCDMIRPHVIPDLQYKLL